MWHWTIKSPSESEQGSHHQQIDSNQAYYWTPASTPTADGDPGTTTCARSPSTGPDGLLLQALLGARGGTAPGTGLQRSTPHHRSAYDDGRVHKRWYVAVVRPPTESGGTMPHPAVRHNRCSGRQGAIQPVPVVRASPPMCISMYLSSMACWPAPGDPALPVRPHPHQPPLGTDGGRSRGWRDTHRYNCVQLCKQGEGQTACALRRPTNRSATDPRSGRGRRWQPAGWCRPLPAPAIIIPAPQQLTAF